MVGNALLFAGTIVLSQRVLYEMPSPTVTLYTLSAMAVVVVMARVVYRTDWQPLHGNAIAAIVGLGLTTAVSRLMLFAGVKRMGGLQTTLLVALETGVTLLLSLLFLHETLTGIQTVGIGVMGFSLLLARSDDLKRRDTQTIHIVNMAAIHFHSNAEAFAQAFQLPFPPPLVDPPATAPITSILLSAPNAGDLPSTLTNGDEPAAPTADISGGGIIKDGV